MNAFNPWDLIKAVGRGFKWFAVGRRTREQDVSYKNHTQASLEPSRLDPSSHGSKPRPYQSLGDDDEQELLARSQPNPFSNPDPQARRWAAPDSTGDISAVGSAGLYDDRSDHLRAMHPTPGTMRRNDGPQELGVVDRTADFGLAQQDTGYHGAAVTPALGTSRPQQASVQEGHEDGWDIWGGVDRRGAGAGSGGGVRPRQEFDGGRF